MRVQCDVCEKAEATLVCCADAALLCSNCDKKVHEANKLAGKHRRVSLSSPSGSPQCDICKNEAAFFFCLQDRALLCRSCDVSTHPLNTLSANHQRFLVTGATVEDSPQAKKSKAPAATSTSPPTWLLDDMARCYHFKDPSLGSSKAGDVAWSPESSIFYETEEENICEVPQTPSPQTTSGLSKSKRLHGKPRHSLAMLVDFDDCFLVPDIGPHSESVSPVKKRKYVDLEFN